MKTTIFAYVAALAVVCLTAGCYTSQDGRSHMGKPFSKDRLESRYERPADLIFAAAKDVISFNGTLASENTVSRTLTGRVDNNTVWVKVDEVEPSISRVIVQARRKSGGGNIDLASEIDKQIALQLQAR